MPSTGMTSALATLLAAVGVWLLLPRADGPRGRWLGALLGAVAVGLWAADLPGVADAGLAAMFYPLAVMSVVAAAGVVGTRHPVYAAVWFSLVLVGTAGLLLVLGAQFLAIATIVVYVGAILVTFLFVLMLARSDGRAAYDRSSWEAALVSVSGALVVGVLAAVVGAALGRADSGAESRLPANAGTMPSLSSAGPLLDAQRLGGDGGGAASAGHVARFGAELFGRHLAAVEVAGLLLLAALVGTAVILSAARSRPVACEGMGPQGTGGKDNP